MDAANVDVAVTGAIYRAAIGTTVPTSPTSTLPAAWLEMGFVGEDGLSETPNDTTKEIKAWQNGTTVRRLITGSTYNFSFKAIETSAIVLETYHKGSAIVTAGGVSTLEVLTPSPQRWMFAFDVVDGDKHERIIIQDGEVTERGAIVYKNDEAIGYQMTVTSYPVENEDGDLVVSVKLSDNAAWDEVAIS
jgi:hypothetical protein